MWKDTDHTYKKEFDQKEDRTRNYSERLQSHLYSEWWFESIILRTPWHFKTIIGLFHVDLSPTSHIKCKCTDLCCRSKVLFPQLLAIIGLIPGKRSDDSSDTSMLWSSCSCQSDRKCVILVWHLEAKSASDDHQNLPMRKFHSQISLSSQGITMAICQANYYKVQGV